MYILFSFFFLTFFMENPPQNTIQVTIHSLRNNTGLVYLSLYRSPDGFPSDPAKAVQSRQGRCKDNKLVFVLENIPPGSYAIAVIHDENEDGKMNTNLLGIPKEGYGASNDAKATFGPPSFTDAKFEHKTSTSLQIKMKYF